MIGFIILNLIDVIIAVIIDLILGDPNWLTHPVIFMGKLIKIIENKARARAKDNKQLKYLGRVM